MTKKKYYQDNSISEFTAEVVAITIEDSGLFGVELNETYFYPEGGGQPGDRGSINNIDVVDVIKDGNRILHLTEKEIEIGDADCTINETHRRHYMIQHTAQHLLSAVLKHELDIDTISVHLGDEESTIDIASESINSEELKFLEITCNTKIRDNVKVLYHETDDDGIKNFNIRRESKFSGYIRIVELENYDCVPCGGIHLSSLSQIGLIKIIGYEKIRGNIRLKFLAGDSAYKDYYEKNIIIGELNKKLSTRTYELLEGFNTLNTSIAQLKYEQKETFRSFVNIVHKSVLSNNPGYLEFENLPGQLVKNIATKLTNLLENPIVIVNINDKVNWFLIDSINESINFNDFKNILLPVIQGKGGGRKSIWQGSGDKENLKEFRKRVINYLPN